ncbi:Hypothetical predicted protein, partial [Paramuricea clavata]
STGLDANHLKRIAGLTEIVKFGGMLLNGKQQPAQTPPPFETSLSFLNGLKLDKDTKLSGIAGDNQVSVMQTMSVWLKDTTASSSSTLDVKERRLQIKRFGILVEGNVDSNFMRSSVSVFWTE